MKQARLAIVLGDQLRIDSSMMKGLDPKKDLVWMAEVDSESNHVWTHQARIALFLSSMRHFRDELRESGYSVEYRELNRDPDGSSLGAILKKTLERGCFSEVMIIEPGEYRVGEEIRKTCGQAKIPLKVFDDDSFLISTQEFIQYSKSRTGLRMEFFYRMMRKRCAVLIEKDDSPVGGQWNFDPENRGSFGKEGPDKEVPHASFKPNLLTRQVIELVKLKFGDHPGSLENFDWPVNRKQATRALHFFIKHHLAGFGVHQDAMWSEQPYLYHSRLSTALNLKLLHPREVIDCAERAYHEGLAPLSSVEGFIRQILGWREYVRGIYFLLMPEYVERNALKAQEKLPDFYWTGQVPMRCLNQVIGQTLSHGYAHHIQRLMITGLYSLLLGVKPKQIHEWYLAVYVDAVEWVELPNTLGMSQYADGGVMASKPYIASGKYIDRMSNYCTGCRFDPAQSTGTKACPFTILYWDFVDRHEAMLRKNPRISMQVKNWERQPIEKKTEIRKLAKAIRERGGLPCSDK